MSQLTEISTNLPTYLEILLQKKSSIRLVYNQKREVDQQKATEVSNLTNFNETSVSEMDLTGTPLTTDLGADDTFCTEVISPRPPSWTVEEMKYFPVPVDEARAYLNKKLRKTNDCKSKPIYCLCDGKDPQHTVVLGCMVNGYKMLRTAVYVLDNINYEKLTLEYMKSDHLTTVRNSTKINYLVTKCYYLWGYNLRNCTSFHNVEYNGSVSVEVISNEIEKSSKNIADYKMTVQAVLGHNNSSLKLFREELGFLQKLLSKLANPSQHSESTVISNNTLESSDIMSKIGDILVNSVNCIKKKVNESLNLKNSRQEGILDKFWHVLKFCRTLEDLRACFNFFLGELPESQIRMQISNNDLSLLAEIVNGIIGGKVGVPSLSIIQCLEILIDLGLEKLKNDYLAIINNFCSSLQDVVLEKWRTMGCDSVTNPSLGPKRKTRSTITNKTSFTDISKIKLKLSYLDNMHKVIELILLCKENVQLSEEVFDHCCEALCNNFIVNAQLVNLFHDFNKPRLCEFTFNSLSMDSSVIKRSILVSRTVKLTTVINEHSEITTVYHCSEYPIFPPTLFDNYSYDKNCDNDDALQKLPYITKLVSLFGSC